MEEVDFLKYEETVNIISKKLREAANDPKVIERGEELQRILRPTWKDLNQPFTI